MLSGKLSWALQVTTDRANTSFSAEMFRRFDFGGKGDRQTQAPKLFAKCSATAVVKNALSSIQQGGVVVVGILDFVNQFLSRARRTVSCVLLSSAARSLAAANQDLCPEGFTHDNKVTKLHDRYLASCAHTFW